MSALISPHLKPGSDAPSARGSNTITIDLDLSQLIEKVDTNVRQEIIILTADKARLCLRDTLQRMEHRKAWIAPAGILATLLVVFPTTTFQDFLNLSKDFWKAFLSIAALAAFAWLVVCLARIKNSLTVDDIVSLLGANSIVPQSPPPQQPPQTP
jgi:hypothetical protein